MRASFEERTKASNPECKGGWRVGPQIPNAHAIQSPRDFNTEEKKSALIYSTPIHYYLLSIQPVTFNLPKLKDKSFWSTN